MTLGVSALILFVLPDFPETSKMLSPAEKALAILRMAEDGGEADVPAEGSGAVAGLRLAFKDLNCYLLALMLGACYLANFFKDVFPTLILTLGYGHSQTLLIMTAPWFFALVVSLAIAWNSDRMEERFWHMCLPFAIAVVGCIICASTMATAARFFGFFLAMFAIPGTTMLYTWIVGIIVRPTYKRSVAIAAIYAFTQLVSISGGYVWSKKNFGPRYWPSFLTSALCYTLAITVGFIVRRRVQGMNRELDEKHGRMEGQRVQEKGDDGMDLADYHERKFRYLI